MNRSDRYKKKRGICRKRFMAFNTRSVLVKKTCTWI